MIPDKETKYPLPRVGYTRTFQANDISRTITNDSMGMAGYSGTYSPSTVLESPSNEITVLLRPEDNTSFYYMSFYTKDWFKVRIERRGKEDLFVYVKKDVFYGMLKDDRFYY